MLLSSLPLTNIDSRCLVESSESAKTLMELLLTECQCKPESNTLDEKEQLQTFVQLRPFLPTCLLCMEFGTVLKDLLTLLKESIICLKFSMTTSKLLAIQLQMKKTSYLTLSLLMEVKK